MSSEEEMEYVWKVTWFPDDVAERVVTGTEEDVRRAAERNADYLPIIERAPVEWEVVRNYYLDGGTD